MPARLINIEYITIRAEKVASPVTALHLPTRHYNMVNFGLLAAEIVSLVWGTPGNFNGFRVLAALLHCTVVVSMIRTLRR